MKGLIMMGLAALVAVVAAHPFKISGHAHQPDKRAYVTEVTYTTVTVADAVVWVDIDGVPYTTEMVEALTTLSSSSTVASFPSTTSSEAPTSSQISSSWSSSITPSATGSAPVTSVTVVTSYVVPSPVGDPSESSSEDWSFQLLTEEGSLSSPSSTIAASSVSSSGGSILPTQEASIARNPVTSSSVLVTSSVIDTNTLSFGGGLILPNSLTSSTESLTISPSATDTLFAIPTSSSLAISSPVTESPMAFGGLILPSSLLSFAPSPTTSSSTVITFVPQAAEKTPSVEAASAPTTGEALADTGPIPLGVAWDAFYATSDGQTHCKTDDMIRDEFGKVLRLGYNVVRLYGSSCDQVQRALPVLVANKQKVIFGIYAPQESVSESVRIFSDAIKRYAGGKWDMVSMVTVENERINAHELTVSNVIDLIGQTRRALRNAGYQGPVGAVDTVPAMIRNPGLCDASDIAAVNCHAFFDGNVLPQDAGTFVRSEVKRVQQACGGKRVVVTESGWPYRGDANQKAVPSRENQRIAVDAIRREFPQDMILFSPFDSNWKTDEPATFNAEKHWGFVQ